ncbi:MAG: MBL fold metallo-hydrolase [Acetobacteraceae bacterium]|nr:MBL fold metallo-hydrolase [Acetobacteraceae bacterium]
MRVILLGTGGSAGVPTLGGADGRGDWGECDPAEPRNRRGRTSIAIQAEGGTLLVDTGPDMRAQLMAGGIGRVDAILYTHAHADHIMGLDDVRILNRLVGRPIQAFGTAATMDDIAARFAYAFRPWRPPGFYRPVVEPVVVAPDAVIAPCGFAVRLFDQDHGMVRTLGLRVGGFGYSTDVVVLDERAFAVLAGVDTWVVSCFQRGPHRTHARLSEVLRWVERLGPRRTILTHMGTDLDWAWMQANLPAGVEAGYDGMEIALS